MGGAASKNVKTEHLCVCMYACMRVVCALAPRSRGAPSTDLTRGPPTDPTHPQLPGGAADAGRLGGHAQGHHHHLAESAPPGGD